MDNAKLGQAVSVYSHTAEAWVCAEVVAKHKGIYHECTKPIRHLEFITGWVSFNIGSVSARDARTCTGYSQSVSSLCRLVRGISC